MALQFRNEHYMPSGIPAGTEIGGPMRTALANHAGLPLSLQPLIEEGTYDDFKACIFRFLSGRTCEIWLEDIALECQLKGIRCELYSREWRYFQSPSLKCVTSVQIRMSIKNAEFDVKEFVEFIAKKYEFRYNRMTVNRKACTEIGHGYVTLDPSVEVEAEIMWPYWM